MKLFSLPAHAPFLDAVAAEWLEHAGDDPLRVGDGIILLPTRRAARALAEAFLRVSGGRALLLPRIVALGALDETPLALAGVLDLPPAVDPMRRNAELARLVLAMGGANGAPRSADGAWRLAADLAALMDEAERAEIDLARTLPEAAAPQFAAHWAHTLTFLRIVTEHWPNWLKQQGVMSPGARSVALLDAQAAAWGAAPPAHRVLLAGVTAGYPAIGRLAKVVASLPAGAVLLPGLDRELAEEVWQGLDDGHYQAGLRDLLAQLGATRADVAEWPARPRHDMPENRLQLLARALLPGRALSVWRDGTLPPSAGLWRLDAADEQQEAMAIALILRDALERPGARAALVTPDRELAGRVTKELSRFGVIADDSAGEKLSETPPAVFLRLLAQAVAEELAPVQLLALLKHPMAALGLAPPECRAATRMLERACLRGPRPMAGLTGLRQAVERPGVPGEARGLVGRLERRLAPLLRVMAAVAESPVEWLSRLIESAELLAATDEAAGATRLWAAEEGEALAERLAAALRALVVLSAQPPASLPSLLDALLEGAVVRSRRALRGRQGTEHPRVFIWGLLEARLQSAEVMVLGGLAEGVWPPATDPGPWLSRPMRRQMGLPSPEQQVGQAAHDFAGAACAAPEVVLSCPRRRDGAPTVPARWLVRLEAMLAGTGGLPAHPAGEWAHALDQPDGPPKPVAPPRPCPPLRLRPKRLSVTEIEIWIRDPYAIYARHVLRLRPLDALDQDTDAADYGSLVHNGVHKFLERYIASWPANAAAQLREALLTELAAARFRPALAAWWAPRLERIADFVAQEEGRRRSVNAPVVLRTELSGTWDTQGFTLSGRADRIERRSDGSLAILDYKTGYVPSQKDVDAGLAPQLLLEAAMAAEGAFGEELRGHASELAYWRLTGGWEPGEVCALYGNDAAEIGAAVAGAADALRSLVEQFDGPRACYLAQPHPARAPRFADFAQLARVAEWATAGEVE
ncbi:MAG: double-strand break repair protein AddB [Acetobacteraceae bacterium]|nr:double-strand break repair protein AddB [Acetobacteraceae bacterium]